MHSMHEIISEIKLLKEKVAVLEMKQAIPRLLLPKVEDVPRETVERKLTRSEKMKASWAKRKMGRPNKGIEGEDHG